MFHSFGVLKQIVVNSGSLKRSLSPDGAGPGSSGAATGLGFRV